MGHNLHQNDGEPEGRIIIIVENNGTILLEFEKIITGEENNNTYWAIAPKSLLQILVWIIQPGLHLQFHGHLLSVTFVTFVEFGGSNEVHFTLLRSIRQESPIFLHFYTFSSPIIHLQQHFSPNYSPPKRFPVNSFDFPGPRGPCK